MGTNSWVGKVRGSQLFPLLCCPPTPNRIPINEWANKQQETLYSGFPEPCDHQPGTSSRPVLAGSVPEGPSARGTPQESLLSENQALIVGWHIHLRERLGWRGSLSSSGSQEATRIPWPYHPLQEQPADPAQLLQEDRVPQAPLRIPAGRGAHPIPIGGSSARGVTLPAARLPVRW